jgi:hypothetical protein
VAHALAVEDHPQRLLDADAVGGGHRLGALLPGAGDRVAGDDAVHADPVGLQLVGEVGGQGDHAGVGQRGHRGTRGDPLRGDARDVDDRRPIPGAQRVQRLLDQLQRPADLRGQAVLEQLAREPGHRPAAEAPGVVDHPVQPP